MRERYCSRLLPLPVEVEIQRNFPAQTNDTHVYAVCQHIVRNRIIILFQPYALILIQRIISFYPIIELLYAHAVQIRPSQRHTQTYNVIGISCCTGLFMLIASGIFDRALGNANSQLRMGRIFAQIDCRQFELHHKIGSAVKCIAGIYYYLFCRRRRYFNYNARIGRVCHDDVSVLRPAA